MALTNPKLFGLNVLSFLSDVENNTESLNALNLPPLDLDVIRGSSASGASLGDWIGFSRLSQPIFRTLDRYLKDTETYGSVLSTRASADTSLFGNLNINGSLSGKSIRYRYVDGTGPSALVKIADISTSRISAWSSTATPTLSTSPIFYGARVSIISGGTLQFGTPTNSNQIRLQTTLVPQVKEFNSEFPTTKISCTIGGKTVTLYAMKGIPLVFRGFFRNLDANITLTSLLNNTPSSWKIVDVQNPNSFSRFANVGSLSSTINFRSATSRDRYIEFYYNPEYISTITINNGSITELPKSVMSSLKSLNISYNNIVNFPDLTFISPNLKDLLIMSNPLYLSENENERKLNSNIINKIPTTVTSLHIGQCFYGSIPLNLIGNRFPNLVTLNLSRSSGPYYHPDSDDLNAYLPNVPNSCETYTVRSNDFRTIGSSSGNNLNIKELTNLITLDVAGNYYLTDTNFTISPQNNKITSIDISSTGLSCPNLSGRQTLVSFNGTYCRNIGSIFTAGGTYKFDGCGSLTGISFYASPLTGAMPKFTNPNLSYIDLRYTAMTGGDPNGDNSYIIPEKTFELSQKIVYFFFYSPNVITSPIHPSAFTYTPSLYYLIYGSNGRTTGSFPSLSTCSSLTYLIAYYNNFSGSLPNFGSNPNIFYVDMSYNAFSGNIPAYRNLSSLTYLYLYNNQLTGLPQFRNLPNLAYFYANNNLLSGEIPDFSECPNLFYLVLFNNKFTNYKTGSLAKNYRIRYIDLSSNLLTQQAINSIIDDLLINYESVNRRGVTVNLRGNSLPSGESLDKLELLNSKGWSIVYG